MVEVPVVKVKVDGGYAVINATDFDAETMERYDESKAELTVDEIRAAVAETADVATLEAMLAAEQDGKARKGAIEAIEARIAELEDED